MIFFTLLQNIYYNIDGYSIIFQNRSLFLFNLFHYFSRFFFYSLIITVWLFFSELTSLLYTFPVFEFFGLFSFCVPLMPLKLCKHIITIQLLLLLSSWFNYFFIILIVKYFSSSLFSFLHPIVFYEFFLVLYLFHLFPHLYYHYYL